MVSGTAAGTSALLRFRSFHSTCELQERRSASYERAPCVSSSSRVICSQPYDVRGGRGNRFDCVGAWRPEQAPAAKSATCAVWPRGSIIEVRSAIAKLPWEAMLCALGYAALPRDHAILPCRLHGRGSDSMAGSSHKSMEESR